jgi:hypothetical protein
MAVWRGSGGGVEGAEGGEWGGDDKRGDVGAVDEFRHVCVTEELGGTSISVRWETVGIIMTHQCSRSWGEHRKSGHKSWRHCP